MVRTEVPRGPDDANPSSCTPSLREFRFGPVQEQLLLRSDVNEDEILRRRGVDLASQAAIVARSRLLASSLDRWTLRHGSGQATARPARHARVTMARAAIAGLCHSTSTR